MFRRIEIQLKRTTVRFSFTLLNLLAILMYAHPSYSSEDLLKKAEKLQLTGHADEALPILQELSKKGSIDAKMKLTAYIEARLLHMSPEEADRTILKWVEEGEKAGNPRAYYTLAEYYESGLASQVDQHWLIAPNPEKAFTFYKKSSDAGFSLADVRLGSFYEKGIAVESDIAKAAHYYQTAFDKGNIFAQYQIAKLYINGKDGRAKDIKKAEELLKNLLQYKQTSACADAATMLGNLYDLDKYNMVDRAKAIGYYEIGAENGNAGAARNAGQIYADGQGVPANYEKAFHFFQIAASKGEPVGTLGLAKLYANGQGTEKNVSKAKELLQSLADQGYEEAQVELKKLNN